MDCKRKKKGEEEKNEKSKGVLNNQSEDLDSTPALHYVTLHTINTTLHVAILYCVAYYSMQCYSTLYQSIQYCILLFSLSHSKNKETNQTST